MYHNYNSQTLINDDPVYFTEAFFSHDQDTCFCDVCSAALGEEDFKLQDGWARIQLK